VGGRGGQRREERGKRRGYNGGKGEGPQRRLACKDYLEASLAGGTPRGEGRGGSAGKARAEASPTEVWTGVRTLRTRKRQKVERLLSKGFGVSKQKKKRKQVDGQRGLANSISHSGEVGGKEEAPGARQKGRRRPIRTQTRAERWRR